MRWVNLMALTGWKGWSGIVMGKGEIVDVDLGVEGAVDNGVANNNFFLCGISQGKFGYLLFFLVTGPVMVDGLIVRHGTARTFLFDTSRESASSWRSLSIQWWILLGLHLIELRKIVSKSPAVTTADASDKRQQPNITPSTLTTVAADTTPLDIQTTHEPITHAPTVTTTENIIQSENA
ncbi:hypothetical protein Tco_0642708 [Tanacetum coccineum]